LLLFLETQNLKRQTEALLHFFAHHWKQKQIAHICGNWIAFKNFMGNWSLLTCLLLRPALERKEVQPTTTNHLAPSLHKTHIHTKSSKMCENQNPARCKFTINVSMTKKVFAFLPLAQTEKYTNNAWNTYPLT
jgi:hypothetical protein